MFGHKTSLEEKLLSEAKGELESIEGSVEVLLALSSKGDYATLMGEKRSFFTDAMDDIKRNIPEIQRGLDKLTQLYRTQESEEELPNLIRRYVNIVAAKARGFITGAGNQNLAGNAQGVDRIAQKTLIHDLNDNLTPLYRFSELLLQSEMPQYEGLRQYFRALNSSSQRISTALASLGGLYKVQEQQVTPVDASTLGLEKIVYTIVHVDGDEGARRNLIDALTRSSNIVPHSDGEYGHDGRRVSYEVHSYKSVEEALARISGLGRIHLLITDREMPGRDGYSLLNTLNEPNNPKVRRPEYERINAIAMLTGGITPEEAKEVIGKYGISVLPKPFQPLQLEQQIYKIINP